MMELVSEAIIFAAKAHDGMRRRKSDSPYVLHPLEAAVIVGTMTDDQHVIAAAVLHDVVEDAGIAMDEVEQRFGVRVRQLVESETENKREDLPPEETWRIRKEESLRVLANTEDPAVWMIWIAISLPIFVRSIGIGKWKAMGCGRDFINPIRLFRHGITQP